MHTSQEWLALEPEQRQVELRSVLQEKNVDGLLDYLHLVNAGNYGVYASIGENYRYAVFGRDMINTAEDVLEKDRMLVERVILTLASLQGTKFDSVSEEEPGRIHHEYRSLEFHGQRIPESSERIMRELQANWGGQGTDRMIYYGSVDATPRFVRLVDKYVRLYGPLLLDFEVVGTDGETITVRDSVERAVEWTTHRIQQSEWGLVEYKRANPEGIANQVWKDSKEGYVHVDGTVANLDGGIASAEVQGYAYDAYKAALRLFPDSPEAPEWAAKAAGLQQRVIDGFWMEDQQFFAQALDRSASGQTRQIRTLTSNGALLLDSEILLDLPEVERKKYTDAVVRLLKSKEFLTDAGFRCRALQHKDVMPYTDYHGSYAVWPKETSDILRGLRLHGYTELATAVGNNVIDTIVQAGDFMELFYVTTEGRVVFDWQEAQEIFGKPGAKLCRPEEGQAWSIAAAIAIISHDAPVSRTAERAGVTATDNTAVPAQPL